MPRNYRRVGVRARGVALVLSYTLLMLFGGRSIADAHATLVSSQPTAGAHLGTGPNHVRLLFSEEIDPALAQLSLVAADESVTRLSVTGDPHDVHAVLASVDSLVPGAYRLAWHVVSADGHPVAGSIVFWVGAGAVGPPPATPAVLSAPSVWGPSLAGAPLIPAALRGLGLGTLMALTGLLLCMSLPRALGEALQRGPLRVARWLALAAPVFLALHLGAWLVNGAPDHRLFSASTSALLASEIGRVEIWRVALAALALWALVLADRVRLALLFALSALVVSGATGHSAALHPRWTEPARALHLLAGGAWLGALTFIVVRGRNDTGAFARDALRVSTIALLAAVVVMASGVVQTLFFLSAPLDLIQSPYGIVLLAKAAGLLILIGFGAHHRYRVLPRLLRDARMSGRFAAAVRSEIVVMSIVILLGGLLAYMSPAQRPARGTPMNSTTHTSIE